jgi:hypothetical protein
MDWNTIIKQYDELEKSFSALKKIFDQAEMDYKAKHQAIMRMIAETQKQEAINLSQIHSALQSILESSKALGNNVKQN